MALKEDLIHKSTEQLMREIAWLAVRGGDGRDRINQIQVRLDMVRERYVTGHSEFGPRVVGQIK